VPKVPQCAKCRTTTTTTGHRASRPFIRWCNVNYVARNFPRYVVARVLAQEAARGRVELADGRARIVPEAFAPNVLAALAALDGD
jgi:hypothetical protein